nr:MAG TPA: hypothetical protein [Caudoviricetes sp.]
MTFTELLIEEPSDWDLKYPDYKIHINDTEDHPLIPKMKSRTKETLETMNSKVQTGIDKMMKNFLFQKQFNYKTYCIIYNKSRFKIILKANKILKQIIFDTILSYGMHQSDTSDINLQESHHFNEIIELDL